MIQPGSENGQWLYHLKVQKQPGTLAVPITIRIHLPAHALVIQAPAGAVVDGTDITLQTDLRFDLEIEVLYRVP